MAEQQQPPTTGDMLNMWRDWAQRAEEQWNNYLNQVMGTDAFAATMGRGMETMLALQSQLAQQFETTLKAWNLPTRSDLAAIGERLTEIEERLDQLTELLERDAPSRAGRRAESKPL